MKDFKCRASQVGQIMTNDRSGKGMGQTAKSYCEQWLKEQLYNRKYEFSSKYTQKGNEVEDNSLDFVAEQLGYGLCLKNEQFFENDFVKGTPDAILEDLIIDVKNSWDWNSFPLFAKEIPTKNYYYQLQAYMWLTGIKNAKLIYVLSDTPAHLIEREAWYFAKNNGYGELDAEIYEKFEQQMTYPDVDPKLKLKVFDIAFDEKVIEDIKVRVLQCRDYINEINKF